MALCFEVTVNGEHPITAGKADARVLTSILSYVAANDEISLEIGALVADGAHVDWMHRQLRRGDIVTCRVIDSQTPDQPNPPEGEGLHPLP